MNKYFFFKIALVVCFSLFTHPLYADSTQASPLTNNLQVESDDDGVQSQESSYPIDLLDQIETDAPTQSWWSGVSHFLNFGASPSDLAKEAYHKKDYDLSLQKYLEAQLDHPASQELSLNIGNARYKKKKYEKAIESYKKALVGDNAQVAGSAYYNIGNSYFRMGEFSIQSGKKEGIKHYRSAMANYKKSLELNDKDIKAKKNIEVVQARIKELLKQDEQKQQQEQKQDPNQKPPPKPSQKAKEALARAMQLVAKRQYTDAKVVLENIIQEDETAISFQSHVKRIDDCIKILNGEDPTPPTPQDPRNQQQGLGVI